MIPMDLSLIVSIVALSVSVVTFWLAELRGPDLSLLNDPKFEVSDEKFDERQTQEYTPRWLELEAVPFLFANYGGKAGTILDLKFSFVPHDSFKPFFDNFYARLVTYEGDLSPPVTIMKGDNEYLKASPTIRTVDWKETALAEVLDVNLKIEDIVEKAWSRSKEKFISFCDFLDESQELGKVSCTTTLTKGRFRTKVMNEKILENYTVKNQYEKAVSSLRGCLHSWENLRPTKTELLNKIKRDLEDLVRELKENLKVLKRTVDEDSLGGASKLRVNEWNQLQRVRAFHERKIRWFLINHEEELKKDLTKLYGNLAMYNRSVDQLMSYGEFRAPKHFRSVNAKREDLGLNVEKMYDRLSRLYRRLIS